MSRGVLNNLVSTVRQIAICRIVVNTVSHEKFVLKNRSLRTF